MYWIQFVILMGSLGAAYWWFFNEWRDCEDRKASRTKDILTNITVMRRESTDFHAKICEISMRGKK